MYVHMCVYIYIYIHIMLHMISHAHQGLYVCVHATRREDVSETSILFLWIGLGCFFGTFLQFASFGVMKEGLTMRMRSATMKHLMRMEVGYHDDPDHTPSKNVFALEMYAFRAGNLMTAIGAYANVFGALAVGIVMGFIIAWRIIYIEREIDR